MWVDEGPVAVSVYVQEGNLLAAEATDDTRHYLRRFAVENAIPRERLTELEARSAAGHGVFGELVDEARPELLDKVLTDRFYDNVARFMGSDQKPLFEFTAGVFVDNLQMGVIPKDVLFDAGSMWDAATTVDLDAELIRGTERPRLAKEVKVIHALGDGSIVGALVPRLSYEPVAARALIATMLSSRVLSVKAPEEPVEDDLWEDADREETEMVERDVAPDAPSDRSHADDSASEDSEVIERIGGVAVAEAEGDRYEEAFADVGPDDDSHDDDTTMIAQKHLDPVVSDVALADLRTAQEWLGHGVDVDDDLDAFSDHDDEVRGAGKGKFSTEQHNLDRVEVGDVHEEAEAALPPPISDEILEAVELPQAKYGAPTLTDDVAMEKIEVAQQVLASIGETFDTEKGAGAGRAALQLLLEGAPGAYAHLLTEVAVDEDNRISARHMIRNLYQRPMSEHRKLLNEGLVDLIERALSMGADELTDEAVDHMLEHVAGYRQRIGF